MNIYVFPSFTAYHAPLDIYVELNKIAADPKIHTLSTDKQVNVCVGKEWYRFPSSFFLPGPKWVLIVSMFILYEYYFLARLDKVQEELLYYPRHRRWRRRH